MSAILTCLTDSPSALRVLRAAALCARALQIPVRAMHFGTPTPAGEARLNAMIAGEVGAVRLEVKSASDGVDDAICQVAAEERVAVIVMGALQREKAVRDLVGSTARRVARRAPCSVMLVSTVGNDPRAWSRFVVGVEQTAPARDLAHAVVGLARHAAPQAEVCFALEYRGIGRHAVPPNEFGNSIETAEQVTLEQYQLAKFMQEVDTRVVNTSAVTLAGRPGQEIARYAEDTNADLLGVLAPARPVGFFDRLLSHPITLLLDKLPCSVLLYRLSRAEAEGA